MSVPDSEVTWPLNSPGFASVPAVTTLEVIWTPLPCGVPVIWTSTRGSVAFCTLREMSTTASPLALVVWLTLPRRLAWQALTAGAVELESLEEDEDGLECEGFASSGAGVPARLAQSLASGPLGNHTRNAAGSATEAATAVPRRRRCAGQPKPTRAQTATSTATTQAAVSASSQTCLTSLPVPTVWSTATGQQR